MTERSLSKVFFAIVFANPKDHTNVILDCKPTLIFHTKLSFDRKVHMMLKGLAMSLLYESKSVSDKRDVGNHESTTKVIAYLIQKIFVSA